jgi:hypothetical protein
MMKFVRQAEGQAAPYIGAYTGGALAVGAALAALWLRLGLPRPVCHFREWTGVPCPTCGSTRMIESLLAGDILAAAAWNPLLFLGLVAVALWAVISAARLIFGLPAWRVALAPREKIALRLAACAAIAVCWMYLMIRGQVSF